MQPLNYCRSMVKSYSQMLASKSMKTSIDRRVMSHAVDLAGSSQKFLLPDRGEILDDIECRALSDTAPLRLPYERIALEFPCAGQPEPGAVKSSRRIVFARERDETIAMFVIAWFDHVGLWLPQPEVSLPRRGYIDRTRKIDGFPALYWMTSPAADQYDDSDYVVEIRALLGFLNALSCANVRTDRVESRSAGRKVKAAMPFDSYHVLTIDTHRRSDDGTVPHGGHRSPREHLRRGHVRTYASGLRIWVQATVVNAGRGAGKVTKDYALRAGRQHETFHQQATA